MDINVICSMLIRSTHLNMLARRRVLLPEDTVRRLNDTVLERWVLLNRRGLGANVGDDRQELAVHKLDALQGRVEETTDVGLH